MAEIPKDMTIPQIREFAKTFMVEQMKIKTINEWNAQREKLKSLFPNIKDCQEALIAIDTCGFIMKVVPRVLRSTKELEVTNG